MKKMIFYVLILSVNFVFSQGGFTPISKLRITTNPTEDNSSNQVLIRDSSTGNVNYVSKNNIAPVPSLDAVTDVNPNTTNAVSVGGVGINTTTPQAILDVVSTNSGILIPRVTTTQKNAISAITSMLVYDSTLGDFQYYNGSEWVSLSSAPNLQNVLDAGNTANQTITLSAGSTLNTYISNNSVKTSDGTNSSAEINPFGALNLKKFNAGAREISLSPNGQSPIGETQVFQLPKNSGTVIASHPVLFGEVLDDLKTEGFYNVNSVYSGPISYPDGGVSYTVLIEETPDHIKQTITSTTIQAGKSYTRIYNGSSWTDWVKFSTQEDIDNSIALIPTPGLQEVTDNGGITTNTMYAQNGLEISTTGNGNTALKIAATDAAAFSSIDIRGNGISSAEAFLFGQYSSGDVFFFNAGNKDLGFYTNGIQRFKTNASETLFFNNVVTNSNNFFNGDTKIYSGKTITGYSDLEVTEKFKLNALDGSASFKGKLDIKNPDTPVSSKTLFEVARSSADAPVRGGTFLIRELANGGIEATCSPTNSTTIKQQNVVFGLSNLSALTKASITTYSSNGINAFGNNNMVLANGANFSYMNAFGYTNLNKITGGQSSNVIGTFWGNNITGQLDRCNFYGNGVQTADPLLSASDSNLFGWRAGGGFVGLTNTNIFGQYEAPTGGLSLTNEFILSNGSAGVAFRTSQDGTTTIPRQTNALIDADVTGKAILTKEYGDSNLVHKTGNETIVGEKTFLNNMFVNDAYLGSRNLSADKGIFFGIISGSPIIQAANYNLDSERDLHIQPFNGFKLKIGGNLIAPTEVLDVTGNGKFSGTVTAAEAVLDTELTTLQQVREKIAPTVNYSTTEQSTGGTWIDGKPIYRKVFTVSNTSSDINIDHFLPIENLIYSNFKAKVGTIFFNEPLMGSNTFGDCGVNETNYYIENPNTLSLTNISITLEYTKTTD